MPKCTLGVHYLRFSGSCIGTNTERDIDILYIAFPIEIDETNVLAPNSQAVVIFHLMYKHNSRNLKLSLNTLTDVYLFLRYATSAVTRSRQR